MKTVLLKLSGELLAPPQFARIDGSLVRTIAQHIKQLRTSHHVNIVIGGGNFFRGCKEGKQLGLAQPTADAAGMLATVMNGLIVHDLFKQEGLESIVLNAYAIPGVVGQVNQEIIDNALATKTMIIFTGGTGNPYFSTDTAAVLRALQTRATMLWKASNIDHVYDADPKQNKNARPLKQISYTEVLAQKLAVMDLPAIALAQEHKITIKVFSIFQPNALLCCAHDPDFGSTIQ